MCLIDNLNEQLSKLQISEDKEEKVSKKYIPPHKRKELNELKTKSDKLTSEKEDVDKSNIITEKEEKEEKPDNIPTENKLNDAPRRPNRPKVNVSAINRMINFQLGNQLTKEQRLQLREQAKQKEIKNEKK